MRDFSIDRLARIKNALRGKQMTMRDLSDKTDIWYTDIQKACRPLRKSGEIIVVGKGGVWGNADLIALKEG